MNQAFIDYLDGIRSVETADELERRTTAYLIDLGFDAFTYIGFNPSGANRQAAVSSTFPRDWIQHYIANDYVFIDPIIHVARRSYMPITSEQVHGLDSLTRSQERLHGESIDFGMRRVLAAPVHGPCYGFAFFAARSNQSAQDWADQTRLFGQQLQLVSTNFHSMFVEHIDKQRDKQHAELSLREIECLLWTSRGKSSWDIGQILSISHRTVEKHLASACGKLRVTHKTAAVVRALVDGYINP